MSVPPFPAEDDGGIMTPMTHDVPALLSIWDRTRGVDGWVSLEVSPLLGHDTASTLATIGTPDLKK
jgi:transaldolase